MTRPTLILLISMLSMLPLLAVAAPKPNIVILFADDLGYGDLSSYGHPYIRTPNLDRLAAEGQRWTDFYAPAPVCSPSRGALLTGKLPNRTGLYGRHVAVLFPNDVEGMPEEELTMAEALGEAGYATGIIGKWHLGDAPDKLPTRHGFDYWYGVPYSNDMDWTAEPDFDEVRRMQAEGRTQELGAMMAGRMQKWLNPKQAYWAPPVLRSTRTDGGYQDEEVQRPADQANLTKNYTEEAVAFIDRNKDRPFLLYVPYSMPHTPIFRSDAFRDTSLAGRYGDVIEELDWSVGAIAEALRVRNLDKRTLLVFTSDNGPWLLMQTHGGSAGPLANGKGTTFEGGMRVPAVFWWPGTVAPGVVHGIGSAMDLYATALALGGVDTSAGVDSVDLTSTLTSGAASPRETLFYYRAGELRAVRKGRYKLSFVSEGAYGLPPERTVHAEPLLYDLHTDPGERFDIAARYPHVVTELTQIAAQHRAGLQDKAPLFDARLTRGKP